MKKIYCIVFILISAVLSSQKLFITKSVNDNSNVTAYFSKINTTDGSIMDDFQIINNEPTNYSIRGPVFDIQSNSIYSYSGTRIFRHNIDNFLDYSAMGGTVDFLYPYDQIIAIKNRLFAMRSYNTSGFNYEITLFEIDKNDGSIIDTQTWTVVVTTNGWGSSFSPATNEIYIVLGNNLSKYNIITQELNVYNLPGTDFGTFYPGVICAEGRLFVRKKDFANGQSNNYLVEIDSQTGAVLATNILNPAIANLYYPGSQIVFLAETKEIACLYYGSPSFVNQNVIVKFNIETNVETLLNLPTEIATSTFTENYGSLVSIDSEELGLDEFVQNSQSKILGVYNLLGQKVPEDTYNQILIVEYENGAREKKIKPKY